MHNKELALLFRLSNDRAALLASHRPYRAEQLGNIAILASVKSRKTCRLKTSRVRDTCMSRKQPNILVTGTPVTGKTTTCQQIIDATGFTHVNVGDWVKQHELHSGWDEEHDCYIIDEDKVSFAIWLVQRSPKCVCNPEFAQNGCWEVSQEQSCHVPVG